MILQSLGWFYGSLMRVRNYAYDVGWVVPLRLPCGVLSVGNLSMGGAGKTPLVDWMVEGLKGRCRVAIVSRNYRALRREMGRVDLSGDFGDEPTWLAERHPDVPVFAGPQKWKTAQLAWQTEQPDLIVLDDGFQHRQLDRDVNCLVVDSSASVEERKVFPRGRGREFWNSGLTRADALLLSRCNLGDAGVPFRGPVFRFDYELHQFFEISGDCHSPQELSHQRVGVFSGIAKPEDFLKVIRECGPVEIVEEVRFGDHHRYLKEDFDRLKRLAERRSIDLWITTEKDLVKLPSDLGVPLWAAGMKVLPHFALDEWYGFLEKRIPCLQ